MPRVILLQQIVHATKQCKVYTGHFVLSLIFKQTDSTLTAVNMKKSRPLCPSQELIKTFVYAAIISP